MEKEPLVTKTQDGDGKTIEDHNRAVEFVERHRDLFEHKARGRIRIEPAPTGLDTFAFDLERNTIYISPRFYEELGFSEERTSFATQHEIKHFLEKMEMLAEPRGNRKFEDYLQKVKNDKAYSHMDNCVADIKINGSVIADAGINKDAIRETAKDMYRENLFKSVDITSEPTHIQFSEALLNESQFPERRFTVSPEVRAKLDDLTAIRNRQGTLLIGAITDPNVPMSLRLRLQDKFIWPIVKELREKDTEKKKKEDMKSGDGKDRQEEETPLDPNQIFSDAYNRAAKRVPNAVPTDKLDEAFKKWQKTSGNPLDRADNEYAQKLGIKSEDLKRYREIVASFYRDINPETGESIIDELRKLFSRIIAKRLKPVLGPRYPIEEGEDLVDPAGLVSGVMGGNLEPKVWETVETIQRPGQMFGEVEITLICDRSGSMKGNKLTEQKRAAVLMMEVLKEFEDLCEEERTNLIKPLEIRSEIYSFQGTSQDSIPLKIMSKELGEKERVDVAGLLSSAPGQITSDYATLEAIEANLGTETKRKVVNGELKKIVIVFTDGESNDGHKSTVDRVQTVLGKMRRDGLIAIGVGITQKGASALTTYAPDARLAEKADDLARVLAELLKDHLSGV